MSLRATFLVLLVLISPHLAYAESVGVTTILSGTASLTRDNNTEQLKDGAEVENGDLVRTQDNGRLQIVLADGSVLALAPNSMLRISMVQTTNDPPAREVGLEMLRGFLRVFASKSGADSRFDVTTSQAVTAVRGTQFGLAVSATSTRVMVFEGRVLVCRKFFLHNASLVLGAGDSVTATEQTLSLKQRWTQSDAKRIPAIAGVSPPEQSLESNNLVAYTFPTCRDDSAEARKRKPNSILRRGTQSRDPTNGGGSGGGAESMSDPIPQ